MPKILVVDDEEGMRYVLSSILKKADYDVITAENGKQAIEVLSSHRPDMVFLDIHLPDLDGTEILKEIKKIKDIPIVMCSGFGDVDFAVTAMKEGAFDYISKPFKNDDVLSKARKAIDSVAVSEYVKEETGAGSPLGNDVAAKKKKKVLLPAGIVLASCVVLVGAYLFRPEGVKRKSLYGVTYNNPTSISYDGEHLWVSDWFGQTIYKHVVDEDLSIAKYYSFSDIHPAGIAWGEKHIWTIDSWTSEIYRLNIDDTLSVNKVYSYPGSEPSGIYFDGSFLWVCDSEEDKIYKLLPEEDTLKVVTEYQSNGPNPIGIFWDGNNIWTVDGDLKRIYKHKMDDSLTVMEVYKFPGDMSIKISGIGWDGNSIWVSADKKPEILRIGIKKLKKIDI